MTTMERLNRRLEHAWAYRQRFHYKSHAFMDPPNLPYVEWHETDPKNGDKVMGIQAKKAVPSPLAYIAADCIHNIRATLDNLICALPGSDIEKGEFPFIDHDPAPKAFSSLRKVERALKGITDPDIVRLVEELQPYQRKHYVSHVTQTPVTLPSGLPPPPSTPPKPVGEFLRSLDMAWNVDKHRTTTLAVNVLYLALIQTDNRNWVPVAPPKLGAFKGRHEVWRFRRIGPPDGQTYIEPHYTLNIGFAEGPFAGFPVDTIIFDLCHCVRNDVLPLFDKWLS